MPRVMQIIYEINERFCKELWNYFPNDFQKISKLAIVADDTVRMAHLAIAGSFSINGVSALHSEILKERVFTDFYKIYSSSSATSPTALHTAAGCARPTRSWLS